MPMLRLVTPVVVLVVTIRGAAAQTTVFDAGMYQDWVHALKDRDPEVGLKAARSWVNALENADPARRKRAAAVLRAGIAHVGPEGGERARKILARIGPGAKGAVPALVEMLSDPDDQVVISAGLVLGAFGPAAE